MAFYNSLIAPRYKNRPFITHNRCKAMNASSNNRRGFASRQGTCAVAKGVGEKMVIPTALGRTDDGEALRLIQALLN